MSPTATDRTPSGTPPPEPNRPAQTAPAHPGLLAIITANSLDADYAHVHQQKLAAGKPRTETTSRSPLVLSAVVLCAFGLLLVTAATQAQRVAGDQASSRQALIQDIAELRAELTDLRGGLGAARLDVVKARQRAEVTQRETSAAERSAARLGGLTGALPVRGEGIRMVVDDDPNSTLESHRVLDVDLRHIVNGMRQAGSEAIAINGQRLTARTAIRFADRQITVNYVSLQRPYVIEVVGDSRQLQARFAESDTGLKFLLAAQSNGLQVSSQVVERLQLPAAAPARLRLPTLQEGRSQ